MPQPRYGKIWFSPRGAEQVAQQGHGGHHCCLRGIRKRLPFVLRHVLQNGPPRPNLHGEPGRHRGCQAPYMAATLVPVRPVHIEPPGQGSLRPAVQRIQAKGETTRRETAQGWTRDPTKIQGERPKTRPGTQQSPLRIWGREMPDARRDQ